MPSRLELLRGFVAQRPDDPFPRYGLAMELRNAGDLSSALAEFEELLSRFPDYVPAYLHAGGTAHALGQRARAREIYEAGVALCGRVGDAKAGGELSAALAAL